MLERDYVTEAWVNAQVEKIKTMADDPEAAHSEEDKLHQTVLLAISQGCSWPCACANAALKTREIKFPRWCA